MGGFQTLPPPPGGDHSKARQLLASIVFSTILALIAVLLRMYARVKLIRNVGWDDYTIVTAMVRPMILVGRQQRLTGSQVVSLINMIITFLLIHHGMGRHMYYLQMEDLALAGLYFHLAEILYHVCTALIKVSACLFLLRIMARGTSRILHWFLYSLMVMMVILCIAVGLVILLQCIPVEAGWDPRIKGKCLSYERILGVGYALGGGCGPAGVALGRKMPSLTDRQRGPS